MSPRLFQPPEGLVWFRVGTCSDPACPNHDPATETSTEVSSFAEALAEPPADLPERS